LPFLSQIVATLTEGLMLRILSTAALACIGTINIVCDKRFSGKMKFFWKHPVWKSDQNLIATVLWNPKTSSLLFPLVLYRFGAPQPNHPTIEVPHLTFSSPSQIEGS
jgi:hypothetical protein